MVRLVGGALRVAPHHPVPVVAVVVPVTVADSTVAARLPHLLRCRLVAGGEGRAQQRNLPPGRGLVLG